MSQPSKDYLLSIDSHFHIYKQFKLAYLLDSAYDQLVANARIFNADLEILPVLFLADDIDSTGFDFFNQHFVQSNQDNDTGWIRDSQYHDEHSILLTKNSSQQILVVRGCQLISSENLEVLIIGRKVSASLNRQSVNDIIQAYKDECLVILPWAVGKWLGKRGQIIFKMMELYKSSDFCLGDNGGRPGLWKKISQFDLAGRKGFPILRGSDPLPLKREENKAGSYGFSIRVNNVAELSASSIIAMVHSQFEKMHKFGQHESNIRFIINQIRLRMHK